MQTIFAVCAHIRTNILYHIPLANSTIISIKVMIVKKLSNLFNLLYHFPFLSAFLWILYATFPKKNEFQRRRVREISQSASAHAPFAKATQARAVAFSLERVGCRLKGHRVCPRERESACSVKCAKAYKPSPPVSGYQDRHKAHQQ